MKITKSGGLTQKVVLYLFIVFAIYIGITGCGKADKAPDINLVNYELYDFMLTGCNDNSCSVRWNVNGELGDVDLTQYEVRYSESGITEDNFGNASIAAGINITKISDRVVEYIIDGLEERTTYYFAVRFMDESKGTSGFLGSVAGTTTNAGANLILPKDLTYLGAFRMPGGSNGVRWNYGGGAYYGGGDMTYYPDGDSDGASDGFPGSIFGVGKYSDDVRVSEFSIPKPVISSAKNVEDLNTAKTLQGFSDIRPFSLTGNTASIASIEYMAPQAGQTTGKLYSSWAEYYQFSGGALSQSWCGVNITAPEIEGGWYLGDGHTPHNMSVGGYMFSAPRSWSDANTPGKYLVTGRYSTSAFGSGPSIHIYGPWNEGNPPVPGTKLSSVTLLNYGYGSDTLNNFTPEDRWYGGAWLTKGNNSAVIITGVKALGDVWYGYKDGTRETDCMHSSPPGRTDCSEKGQRGWKAAGYAGSIMFYNPDDFTEVVDGTREAYESQPYAVMNVNEYLYHGAGDEYEQHRLGGTSYDRENGLLYIFELFGDGSKPLVHVWKI